MTKHSLLGTVLALFLLGGIARADILLPDGLNPGDKYRVAFVTASASNAISTNIASYNAIANANANQGGSLTQGLSTTWTVIGSTAAVNAKANTGTDDSPAGPNGVPIYLVDGITRIADNYDDLWDGNILNTLSKDQFGTTRTGAVWTGTSSSGVGVPGRTLGSEPEVEVGSTGQTVSAWIDFSSIASTNNLRFYAISGELTAVPEPSAFLFLGLVGLGLAGMRVRQIFCVKAEK